MSLATVNARANQGITAPLVQVEVHLSGGLPRFNIVGLPETVVRESKDRVRSAISHCGLFFHDGRITVNLAPADLPKEGGRFDLAIAIGILAASDQIKLGSFAKCEFAGELSLSGKLTAIKGALPLAVKCRDANHLLILPQANIQEVSCIQGLQAIGAEHLLDVVSYLNEQKGLPKLKYGLAANDGNFNVDMSEVKAQTGARRALEIAATGSHSMLLIGPPGTGKTMLAERLPTILPEMSESEALEVAAIYSIIGAAVNTDNFFQRPCRSPHHTASQIALVGGGSIPKPGEISLAHNGVLFLDELPEFSRQSLEVLREPLQSGKICISRAKAQLEFPAKFQFIAAMNPCPCGYLGDKRRPCECSAHQIDKYRNKISGPILDRIDIHIDVPYISPAELEGYKNRNESSKTILSRVLEAQKLQLDRQAKVNSNLSSNEIELYCELSEENKKIIYQAIEKFGLSMRAYHNILRVARTIADLDSSEKICSEHLLEAISYRKLDRSSYVSQT